MTCLSHQFLLNELLSTTNNPKNYKVCNQLKVQFFWGHSKNEKEMNKFLLFKQKAKVKIMELSTAANFFQQKDAHLLDY